MYQRQQTTKLESLDCISVQYVYSACIITKTNDVTILHDPWFTEGIYDGSWFQYPKVENPLEVIGDVDFIFISHIHPDHYDSRFIKQYFKHYGVKKIIIANRQPNYLLGKMRSDGLSPLILEDWLKIGVTSIKIITQDTGSDSDIDSGLIIKYKSRDNRAHCVVNSNDIVYDDKTLELMKKEAGEIDILLCEFTGAGPYPQTYFDINDPRLQTEALRKKTAFFERYKKLTNTLDAKVNIPFAGKYILGGKLGVLNFVRGVADAVEVLDFDKKAVVLGDANGVISTSTLVAKEKRTIPYKKADIERVIKSLQDQRMDYERLFSVQEISQLPIKRLLAIAVKNALSRSECESDYFFCIRLHTKDFALINANKKSKESIKFIPEIESLPTPRSEIIIDMRYLFGLLTHVYHWNNAEIGSQFETRRIPNIYDSKAQNFLNFLSV